MIDYSYIDYSYSLCLLRCRTKTRLSHNAMLSPNALPGPVVMCRPARASFTPSIIHHVSNPGGRGRLWSLWSVCVRVCNIPKSAEQTKAT